MQTVAIWLFSGAFALLLAALFILYRKYRLLRDDPKGFFAQRAHELELQEATLSTIFASIPDIVFCKDVNGYFTHCSNTYARYVNLPLEEVIGKNDAMLFGLRPDIYEAYLQADKKVMESRELHVVEERIYSPYHGESRLFETIKTPLVRNGEVFGVMGIARDITERKAMEAAAREASKAKSEFLARMSHEIRTPLNAITGMTYIARNSIRDPEKALRSLDEIETASFHLLGIVNAVLDMAKIESGKFGILEEPFHLVSNLSEVVSIISQRCKDKYIRFEHNITALPDVHLLGDKLRLNQVLLNLLGNSVKFTPPEGTIGFHVAVAEEKPAALRLAFTLSDSGIGMSEEQMDRLFMAFEQADNSIAARFGGTGLGLAISQNLVSLMGGRIAVRSELDKGSVFTFELDFSKTGVEPKNDAENRACDLNLVGKRILLAEDIDINRLILREILGPTKVGIDEAENGRQALDMFTVSPDGHYDLVLMDIQMPDMDGYEATRKIRGLLREDARSVPILAMTANAYREDIDKALAVGMNGHLAKPVNVDVMLRTLAAFLGDAGGRTPA